MDLEQVCLKFREILGYETVYTKILKASEGIRNKHIDLLKKSMRIEKEKIPRSPSTQKIKRKLRFTPRSGSSSYSNISEPYSPINIAPKEIFGVPEKVSLFAIFGDPLLSPRSSGDLR